MLCMLEILFSVCVIEICPPTGNNNARTDLSLVGLLLVVANILRQATCRKLVKLMKVQVLQNAV